MKNRLLALIAVLAIVIAGLSLAACNPTNETYYEYRGGEYIETSYITVDGNSYKSVEDGAETAKGTVKIDGTSITFYVTVGGKDVEARRGKIDDGVITIFDKTGAPYIYYCQKGKTPPDVPPDPPETEKLTVGTVIDAVDKLINDSYKADGTFEYGSANDKGDTVSMHLEKTDGNKIRVIEPDPDDTTKHTEYIINTDTGYVYTKPAGATKYTAKQYIPQGAVEYLLKLYRAELEDVDRSKAITEADGFTYDSETHTVTFEYDYAADLNKYLAPVSEGYKKGKTLEWLLNEYLEQLLPDADMDVDTIIDELITIATENGETTVGSIIDVIEGFGDISVSDAIKDYVTPDQYKKIQARRIDKMLAGAIGYFEGMIADDIDISSIISDIMKDDADIKAIFEQLFPGGNTFDKDAFIKAAFEDDVDTKGLPDKLKSYKKLVMTALRVVCVDDVVDKALGSSKPNTVRGIIYQAIKCGIEFKTLGINAELILGDDNEVSHLTVSVAAKHDYDSTKTKNPCDIFNDNDYSAELELEISEYGVELEDFSATSFVSGYIDDSVYALIDVKDIEDGANVYYEWRGTPGTATVRSAYYYDKDNTTHDLSTDIVTYNADGTFTFTGAGIAAAIANKDYSYTQGITAVFDAISSDNQIFTITVTLIVAPEDSKQMLVGLPAIIKDIVENGRADSPQA